MVRLEWCTLLFRVTKSPASRPTHPTHHPTHRPTNYPTHYPLIYPLICQQGTLHEPPPLIQLMHQPTTPHMDPLELLHHPQHIIQLIHSHYHHIQHHIQLISLHYIRHIHPRDSLHTTQPLILLSGTSNANCSNPFTYLLPNSSPCRRSYTCPNNCSSTPTFTSHQIGT